MAEPADFDIEACWQQIETAAKREETALLDFSSAIIDVIGPGLNTADHRKATEMVFAVLRVIPSGSGIRLQKTRKRRKRKM